MSINYPLDLPIQIRYTGYMNKEYRIKDRYWVQVGYSKGFGLGFRIDRYSANIDFLWFWISLEY